MEPDRISNYCIYIFGKYIFTYRMSFVKWDGNAFLAGLLSKSKKDHQYRLECLLRSCTDVLSGYADKWHSCF
jgi:hypothetical protein